ncbi:HAMP domain-containing histidine kinase [Aestuariibacter halophilus]|uniref:histidine kinase n=1 Tax=Fluctibacter halophilus TaxID=226011 RepID=A0ABS8G7S5_9ALTE|nr:HAMP domain-containing sensor histidine kinase [Aestuariibacter halophilus]MCC2616580.1 HAMP domain-containing histidine kinase [Aestuariibacter halophilus]
MARSLNQKLHRAMLMLVLGMTVVFAALSLVSLFVVEDNFFDHELARQADHITNAHPVLVNGQEISQDMVFYRNVEQSPFADVVTPGRLTYELARDSEYYHLRVVPLPDTTSALLAFRVTERMLVNRSLPELATVYTLIFLVVAGIAVLIARRLSRNVLTPFNRLVDAVKAPHTSGRVNELEMDIAEQDLHAVIQALQQAWTEREQSLSEQLAFNRGISHELRTPLHVAKQALELRQTYPQQGDKADARLDKALRRMENISNAFLWLSSQSQWTDPTALKPELDQVLETYHNEIQKRNLSVQVQDTVTTSLILPPDVVTVVLSNLLANAFSHCNCGPGNPGTISISATEQGVIVSNPFDPASPTPGFGLGMQIVEQLLARFDYQLLTHREQQQFHATVCPITMTG